MGVHARPRSFACSEWHRRPCESDSDLLKLDEESIGYLRPQTHSEMPGLRPVLTWVQSTMVQTGPLRRCRELILPELSLFRERLRPADTPCKDVPDATAFRQIALRNFTALEVRNPNPQPVAELAAPGPGVAVSEKASRLSLKGSRLRKGNECRL